MPLSKAAQVKRLVDEYFLHIAGQFHFEDRPAHTKQPDDTIREKIWDREPEPPTFSGLALHLGFNSLAEFNNYEQSGKFAHIIKRAKLRIMVEYEKRLHLSSPSGAIFALKSLESNEPEQVTEGRPVQGSLQINIVESGFPVANTEKDVQL